MSDAAVLIDDVVIGIVLLVLGVAGITFSYPDSVSARAGISGLLNDYESDGGDIAAMIRESTKNNFLSSGTIWLAAKHCWNEFIQWIKDKYGSADSDGNIKVEETAVRWGADGIIYIDGVAFINCDGTIPQSQYSDYSIEIPSDLHTGYKSFYPFSSNDSIYFRRGNNSNLVHVGYENSWYSITSNFVTDRGIDLLFGYGVDYIRMFYTYRSGSSVGQWFSRDLRYINQPDTYEWYMSLIDYLGTRPPLVIPAVPPAIPVPKEGEEGLIITIPGIGWGQVDYDDAFLDDIIIGVGTGSVALPNIDALTPEAVIPEVIEGKINWDRLREGWAGLASTFPFCIPFDLVGMIQSFESLPERPEPITVNIMPFLPGDAGFVTLDLFTDDFNGVLHIFRTFLFLLFCVGLAILTGRVIKW